MVLCWERDAAERMRAGALNNVMEVISDAVFGEPTDLLKSLIANARSTRSPVLSTGPVPVEATTDGYNKSTSQPIPIVDLVDHRVTGNYLPIRFIVKTINGPADLLLAVNEVGRSCSALPNMATLSSSPSTS